MNDKKEALKARFSADYKRYYLVDLFKREGYVRKKCENCGKYFWTLDGDRKRCDDQPCSPYSFIGSPPTSKRFGYTEAWKNVADFFARNGHTIIKRYPVVSRWRPDLYFTVASIIDFQRIEGGKVVFELPANPLVVPQMSLRFNDVPIVGLSGRHSTAFCMIGQTALANKEGYWKDKTIDLDFKLLTRTFGIPKEEISFIEKVWVGYGAFGYSLEYFVRGLETGNAVFTAFEGTPEKYVQLKERVVDMGAGLERLTWLTQGTPTAYDAYLAPVLKRMREENKIEYNEEFFRRYAPLAGDINLDEFKNLDEARMKIAKILNTDVPTIKKQFGALEATYAIADHSRTLLFAIADGMLPSNSGGGYNLRMIFRRARNFINYYGFKLDIPTIVNWHIDQLKSMYPELDGHRSDVAEVLGVEESRFASSSERVSKIVSALSAETKPLETDDLIRLYDSDGVTPEQLIEAGAKVSMPEDFYEKVQARHLTRDVEEPKPQFDISKVPATKLWYYEEGAPMDFTARVLKVFQGKYVVLNRTVFYPRGGGQEPDRGTIAGAKVVDIEKYGDVVIHKIEGRPPKSGTQVECHVDERRRRRITQIHTATHILNGSSRQILGPWVWQHSAFKEEDYGRIDITHFSHLTPEEVHKIEDLANEIVRKNLKVTNTFMPRGEAESKYGFRLYQGGVVPTKLVRVVNIGGWDIEACGGTHSRSTGEVGLIKITKAERIQDGVERLEFVAGEAAIEYVHRMDSSLDDLSTILGTQRENLAKVATTNLQELQAARSREKALGQTLVELSTSQVLSTAKQVGSVKLYVARQPQLGEDQIIAQGEKCVATDPSLIYVSVFSTQKSARVIAFVGAAAKKAGHSASEIVKAAAPLLGGSGGGSPSFAQGGGPAVDRIDDAAAAAEKLVSTPRS
ncbi:MAG TPA: alanine--tRNA ligase [Nitrososphaerales archaeon]|nr:alanine--tRNA ligase [Nitrososphaerales archaeon]